MILYRSLSDVPLSDPFWLTPAVNAGYPPILDNAVQLATIAGINSTTFYDVYGNQLDPAGTLNQEIQTSDTDE